MRRFECHILLGWWGVGIHSPTYNRVLPVCFYLHPAIFGQRSIEYVGRRCSLPSFFLRHKYIRPRTCTQAETPSVTSATEQMGIAQQRSLCSPLLFELTTWWRVIEHGSLASRERLILRSGCSMSGVYRMVRERTPHGRLPMHLPRRLIDLPRFVYMRIGVHPYYTGQVLTNATAPLRLSMKLCRD